MERLESRLDQELKKWKEREQRYETLFSPSVLKSKEFLKEKLKHYDDIRARVMAGPVSEDKIAMRAFQLERAQLARQVYPNVFMRLLERLVSIFRVNNNIAAVQKTTADNNASVVSAMGKAGLGEHYNLVQQQIKQGQKEFTILVSHQVKEAEKLELQLNFKRDDNGNYHFENYRATLHSEADKKKPLQHTFDVQAGEVFDVNKAYNLLSGRAVQSVESASWKQLDINDKDGAGNLRMKHIPSNYGYDIEKALSVLPIKGTDKNVLIQQLKNGESTDVKLDIKGKDVNVKLAADPLKKDIAIYDGSNQKVSLHELSESTNQPKQSGNVRHLEPKQNANREQSKGKSVKM